MDPDATARPLIPAAVRWYDRHARDLPWRRPGTSAWAVLVSEVMLQQTPVARVRPVFQSWLTRWPDPAALAREEPGEAVRAWGTLGYPRRALRLHAAAQAITDVHGGEVPRGYDDLRALPGVGEYTASAVATFAYRQRHTVLDTNVRRLLARAVAGEAGAHATPTAADRQRAHRLLPEDGPAAARWAVASMELGALICTARAPHCGSCPLRRDCAWRIAGYPPATHEPRRQRYDGTDRQARGSLLAVLRGSTAPVGAADLASTWTDDVQRERALDGLVADGLVEPLPDGTYRLPVRPA